MCITLAPHASASVHAMDHSGHDAHATPAAAEESASLLDIVKHRHALGEITREQFEEMKRTLGVSDASSLNERAHH